MLKCDKYFKLSGSMISRLIKAAQGSTTLLRSWVVALWDTIPRTHWGGCARVTIAAANHHGKRSRPHCYPSSRNKLPSRWWTLKAHDVA